MTSFWLNSVASVLRELGIDSVIFVGEFEDEAAALREALPDATIRCVSVEQAGNATVCPDGARAVIVGDAHAPNPEDLANTIEDGKARLIAGASCVLAGPGYNGFHPITQRAVALCFSLEQVNVLPGDLWLVGYE